jgi:hypothetical protein
VGLTRGIALPVAAVVLTHLVLRIRGERYAGVPPLAGQRWRAGVMVLGATASVFVWPAFVGWRTGSWSTFFDVQAAWGQHLDRGPFVPWLLWAWTHGGVPSVILFVVLVVAVCAIVLSPAASWMPVEVRVWGVAYPLYLVALTAPSTSVIRFLILDFPLAAAVGALLVRGLRFVTPALARGGVVLLVTVVAMGLMWWWTSTLLVYDPPSDWPP